MKIIKNSLSFWIKNFPFKNSKSHKYNRGQLIVVGGEKEYADMMQWATKTLNKTEIDMFDKVMEQGNPLAAFFAVRSLAYRYEDAVGVDGRMTTGTAPRTSGDTFRSQQELVAAMSDQRYDNDPAYRQDVIAKLDRSDMKF